MLLKVCELLTSSTLSGARKRLVDILVLLAAVCLRAVVNQEQVVKFSIFACQAYLVF